jgi:hypothetical protein
MQSGLCQWQAERVVVGGGVNVRTNIAEFVLTGMEKMCVTRDESEATIDWLLQPAGSDFNKRNLFMALRHLRLISINRAQH